MILGFKTKFNNGKDTNFVIKILACIRSEYAEKYKMKKHSIRKGNRWKADMLIHMAIGVRTKHYIQFNRNKPELSTSKSVQSIEIRNLFNDRAGVNIDGRELTASEIDLLAMNDGFDTTEEFWDFFKSDEFEGQIIHWTDLRY